MNTLVNITINGRPVHARTGQTVLEAATAAGIDIPTLCDHPELHPAGACRVCLVEIEKQRALQPACTFPVAEGLVIQTESEKVVKARKFSLQMLFSERTHYCMYCPISGTDTTSDCELQRLAYRYGLAYWEHEPDYSKRWPMDASRPYMIMDHSRCILCRRCIRACSELAANHTLGVHQRGARTMVGADDDVMFAQSSCVNCGSCLQVCPTGAITDRRSSYLGHAAEVTRTRTTCMGCAVGCGIEAITRDNTLLRIEGDWTAPNAGLLCVTGRFEAVQASPPRLKTPMVRKNGQLAEASWGEALETAARKLRQTKSAAALVTPRTTNEGLVAFGCFVNEVLHSDEMGLLYGGVPPLELGTPGNMEELGSADCIIVVGGDPLKHQKVLGFIAKRAFDNDARLMTVNDSPTELDFRAKTRLKLDGIAHAGASPFAMLRYSYHLRLDAVGEIRSAVEAAQRPMILYGPNLSTAVYAALRGLPRKVKFLPLVEGTNAVGADRLGLSARVVKGDTLFVLAGDELPDGHMLPKAEFTIVQAAYRTAWTDAADVVLPARTWAEKKGHIVNCEGREMPVVPLMEAPADVQADWVPLSMLASLMGHPVLYGSLPQVQGSL